MGKRTGNNAQIKFNPQYPYTIVCEGVDEYYFLIAYLDYLERNEREKFVDCHNVVDFGGINDMMSGSIAFFPNFNSTYSVSL